MSPTAFLVCGRILFLVATIAQLARAAPSWSAKEEYLISPDSIEEYLSLREPVGEGDKRAPWAHSASRSDKYLQRSKQLTSDRKQGKREKGEQHTVEVEELSDEEVATLLKLLQLRLQGLDYEAMDFAVKELNERGSKATDRQKIGKSEVKELRGPVDYQSDRSVGFKRSASPFNLGLGQHAASAAMSAYENILDESRNYKPDRPSSPVRFLGKR